MEEKETLNYWYSMYQKVEEKNVVDYILSYPRLADTGHWMLDNLIDFYEPMRGKYQYDINYKREMQLAGKILAIQEEAVKDVFIDYDLRIIKEVQVIVHGEQFAIKAFSYMHTGIVCPRGDLWITNSNEESFYLQDLYLFLKFNYKPCPYNIEDLQLTCNQHNWENRTSYLYYEARPLEHFTINPIVGQAFYLFRTTFTNIEELESYIHSHIPGGNYNNIGKFCVGNWEYGSNYYPKNKINDYSYYLFAFFDMLKMIEFESLTGGPHMFMEKLQPYKLIDDYIEDDDGNEVSISFISKPILESAYAAVKKAIKSNSKTDEIYIHKKYTDFEKSDPSQSQQVTRFFVLKIINERPDLLDYSEDMIFLPYSLELNNFLVEKVNEALENPSKLSTKIINGLETIQYEFIYQIFGEFYLKKDIMDAESTPIWDETIVPIKYKGQTLKYKHINVTEETKHLYAGESAQTNAQKAHFRGDEIRRIQRDCEILINTTVYIDAVRRKRKSNSTSECSKQNSVLMSKLGARKRMEWSSTVPVQPTIHI